MAHVDHAADLFLAPGDRMVVFGDGVVESRPRDGRFFGEPARRPARPRRVPAQPTPETLRRLIAGVLDHEQDTLQDDATVLMLKW